MLMLMLMLRGKMLVSADVKELGAIPNWPRSLVMHFRADSSKLVSRVSGVILQSLFEAFSIQRYIQNRFCNISLYTKQPGPVKCTEQSIYQQYKIVGNSFRLFDQLLMRSNLPGSILPIVRTLFCETKTTIISEVSSEMTSNLSPL